jgi:hypothetical protein
MSAERTEARVLRPRGVLFGVVGGAEVLFLAGAAFSYSQSRWSWITLCFGALSALGSLAIVELATSRIVLADGRLETGSIWNRRRFSPAEIRSVKWESGGGVAIQLASGRWIKLPELGYNSQGLTNSIRAWLKRHRQPNPSD